MKEFQDLKNKMQEETDRLIELSIDKELEDGASVQEIQEKYKDYLKEKITKKVSWTKKVDDFLVFIFNPFEVGFYTVALTYSAVLGILYLPIKYKVLFWSIERLALELQALIITVAFLTILAILIHYIARLLDKFRS